jgi:hypothetical protein
VKDIVLIIIVFLCAAFAGWGIGKLSPAEDISNPPKFWYCIEGKVYEQNGDTYITVVPARGCLPVSKD